MVLAVAVAVVVEGLCPRLWSGLAAAALQQGQGLPLPLLRLPSPSPSTPTHTLSLLAPTQPRRHRHTVPPLLGTWGRPVVPTRATPMAWTPSTLRTTVTTTPRPRRTTRPLPPPTLPMPISQCRPTHLCPRTTPSPGSRTSHRHLYQRPSPHRLQWLPSPPLGATATCFGWAPLRQGWGLPMRTGGSRPWVGRPRLVHPVSPGGPLRPPWTLRTLGSCSLWWTP